MREKKHKKETPRREEKRGIQCPQAGDAWEEGRWLMAILVTSFIKPGKQAKEKARALVQYNGTRPGKDGEEIVRTLFGHDGPLTDEQVERLINEAPKNTYFWSFILSPDPNGEENANRKLNLQKLTKDLVNFLEKRLNRQIEFIAAVQNDHTDIPHVHSLLLIQRRGREMLITKETLEDLRTLAAGKALAQQADLSQVRPLIAQFAQRQDRQRQDQDQVQILQREQIQPMIGSLGGRASIRASRPIPLCYNCEKPRDRYHECEEERELTLKRHD